MTAAAILDRAAAKPIPNAGILHGIAWLARFQNHALELTQRAHDRHGTAVQTGFGLVKSVGLFGPDANRFVLLDRDRVFSAKRSWELIMGRIFGGGLLLRDGEDHRRHRRLMREAFLTPALASYCDRMNPVIAREIEGWLAAGTHLQAFPALKHLTLKLAWDVFAGVELGAEAARLNRAFEATVAAAMSLVRLPLPGLEFQRGLEGRRLLTRTFRRLVVERRERGGPDMLSRLCTAEGEEGRLSDVEIAHHMSFLMMAAHDTTTSTLTSLLYLLARHPEWQERVREESLALGAEFMGFEDRDRLEAATHSMHETLRLYPPLSTIPRVVTRDCDFAGYHLPEGALVSIFPIHTHRMPEWWSEPDRFDPDRFSRERREHERHSHVFVPFGGGEHMCLGLRFAEMQIRAILHQLVRRARFEVPAGYVMPVQEAPISKPRDGLPLRITRLA
jgi:cytochrome P450